MVRKLAILLLLAAPVAAQTTFISGTVTAADTGRPLPDMTVAAYTLSGTLAGITATDMQGRYTLALPPASYHVLAYDNTGTYATNYFPNARSFETSAVLSTSVAQPLSNVDFALVRGVRVSGRVDSATTNAVLRDITVAAYNLDGTRRAHTKTNSSGNWVMVLPPGDYKFVAFDEDFAKATVYVPEFYSHKESFETASTVSVQSDLTNINFTLVPGGKVSGQVTDRLSGTPLAGVSVGAYDLTGTLRYSATTDVNGQFIFAVPAGTYKLAAADPEKKYVTNFFQNVSNFAAAATVTVHPSLGQVVANFGLEEFREQTDTVMFVAAAANQAGGNNTFFQTDLWIQNPSSSNPLQVLITFLVGGQDNSERTGVNVTVAPRQQLYLPNVLERLFNATGVGALKLEAPGPFRVMSRTYNNPSNSAQVGTFGLAVPGETIAESLGRGIIAGLANNSSYRSNVGVLNPHARPIDVKFELFDADGRQLGQATRQFLPLEWFQANIFAFLAVNTTTDSAYVVLSSTDGSFFSYASVVDAKSGDGMIVSPVAD